MQKFRLPIVISAFVFLLLMVPSLILGADSKPEAGKPDKRNRGQGEVLFRANGCFDCHSVNGRGSADGINLSSVGLHRDRKFLEEHLRDPDEHVNKNKKAFNSEPNLMTNPNLSRKEVDLIVCYLLSLKKPVAKSGQARSLTPPANIGSTSVLSRRGRIP